MESLLTQTLIVHIIRTQRIPFLQSRASKPMLFTTLAVMAVGPVAAVFAAGARSWASPRCPPIYFLWLAGFLVAYGVLTHAVKMWFARRFGTD